MSLTTSKTVYRQNFGPFPSGTVPHTDGRLPAG